MAEETKTYIPAGYKGEPYEATDNDGNKKEVSFYTEKPISGANIPFIGTNGNFEIKIGKTTYNIQSVAIATKGKIKISGAEIEYEIFKDSVSGKFKLKYNNGANELTSDISSVDTDIINNIAYINNRIVDKRTENALKFYNCERKEYIRANRTTTSTPRDYSENDKKKYKPELLAQKKFLSHIFGSIDTFNPLDPKVRRSLRSFVSLYEINEDTDASKAEGSLLLEGPWDEIANELVIGVDSNGKPVNTQGMKKLCEIQQKLTQKFGIIDKALKASIIDGKITKEGGKEIKLNKNELASINLNDQFGNRVDLSTQRANGFKFYTASTDTAVALNREDEINDAIIESIRNSDEYQKMFKSLTKEQQKNIINYEQILKNKKNRTGERYWCTHSSAFLEVYSLMKYQVVANQVVQAVLGPAITTLCQKTGGDLGIVSANVTDAVFAFEGKIGGRSL